MAKKICFTVLFASAVCIGSVADAGRIFRGGGGCPNGMCGLQYAPAKTSSVAPVTAAPQVAKTEQAPQAAAKTAVESAPAQPITVSSQSAPTYRYPRLFRFR